MHTTLLLYLVARPRSGDQGVQAGLMSYGPRAHARNSQAALRRDLARHQLSKRSWSSDFAAAERPQLAVRAAHHSCVATIELWRELADLQRRRSVSESETQMEAAGTV